MPDACPRNPDAKDPELPNTPLHGRKPEAQMILAGLVAQARPQGPDPIPNSAVKRLRAHGTVSQDPGESVAARPAKIIKPIHSSHTHRQGHRIIP